MSLFLFGVLVGVLIALAIVLAYGTGVDLTEDYGGPE